MITNIEVLWKDPSRKYSCNRVKVTDENGNTSDVVYSHDELEIEQLRLKMITAGVNPKDLERFGELHYKAGEYSEAELHAGESL